MAARSLLLAAIVAGARVARADERPADCVVDPQWQVDSVSLPNDPARTSYVELGDIIAVTSKNLPALRGCAKPRNPVVLYLAGMPVTGMVEYPPSDPASRQALFTLKITSDNRAVWNRLLGSPTPGQTNEVSVSLGLADGFALLSDARIKLRPLPPIWFAVWAVLFVVGLGVFFRFAWKSNMLRGGTPAGGRAFSLSRSQAAWWFFLVLAAYLLIGLTTGDYTTSLNQTALVLLGIAAAASVGSAAVDASNDTPAVRTGQNTEKARILAIAENARTAAEKDKLAKLNGESQGWLRDVLSDSEGMDFHRFQMLVWSFVLGIIFVSRVYQELAMPVFDATLLGLMGLSAGTYVGLKIPETTK